MNMTFKIDKLINYLNIYTEYLKLNGEHFKNKFIIEMDEASSTRDDDSRPCVGQGHRAL